MKNSWPNISISEISENLDSKRIPVSKSKRKSGHIPYYGATGIVDYVDDHIFDEELLLIGEDGADWSGGANTAFIINGKSWVNNHAHVLRIKDANIQFVKNYLNHSDLRNYISGTTRGKLNQASLNKIIVPNPPIKTQQRIAGILSSVDDAIQKTDQIIQKVDRMKRGLTSDLLVSNVKSAPLVKLQDLITIKNGYAYSGKNITDKETDKIILTPGNVAIGGGFNETKLRHYTGEVVRNYVLKPGDLFIAMTDLTPQANFLGYPAVVPDRDGKIFLHNQRLGLIQLNSELVNKDYLYFVLMSESYRNHVVSTATGTTVRHTSVSKILDYKFRLPSLDVQNRAIKILKTIEAKLADEKDMALELLKLKTGLMDDIFSRKVEVN